jgi:hypothetical protein
LPWNELVLSTRDSLPQSSTLLTGEMPFYSSKYVFFFRNSSKYDYGLN